MTPILLAFALAQAPPSYPQTRLAQPGIALTLYRPDAETGFYRGTRFDHAGVIANVKIGDHNVFGPWKSTHNPANNDDITGPAEEFGMAAPLGYNEAESGGAFLKIGVGLLAKPDDKPYQFYRNYPVKKFAPWGVKIEQTRVTFRQRAEWDGFGYDYTKVVELVPGKRAFAIRHALKNTGSKRITTDVYNHNFFNVDADPVGPNYSLEFPAEMASIPPRENFEEYLRVAGKVLTYTKPLGKSSAATRLTGLSGGEYRFALTHAPSGIKLRVRGTGAEIAKTNFWSLSGCLCPEPFVAIDAAPGAQQNWDVTYDFDN